MTENVYLFNPFDIKNWENQDIKNVLDELIDKYLKNDDSLTVYQRSLNVENLANQLYLIGEMIARLSEEVLLLKNEVNTSYDKQVYMQRKQWSETNTEKAPAISYFQALASDFVKDERINLSKKESDLKRFKYAYDSIEAKMNANKKKMDAQKYEEFGN